MIEQPATRRKVAVSVARVSVSALLSALAFILGSIASAQNIAADPTGTIRVRIVETRGVSDTLPLASAFVRVDSLVQLSDTLGVATLRLPPGNRRVAISRLGFAPDTVNLFVTPMLDTTVVVVLTEASAELQSVVVSATRGERRIEDEPLRVEVLAGEEVEEKLLMTPGDITMMLNETSGLRVQTTSPSLGGASVRVQGLRGRYTQILSDGLPLYGGQTGGLGLLQIPPMDLAGVEIIKGVASALYGGSALGGVVNLLSRRPADTAIRELLANQTTLRGSDLVGFDSRQIRQRFGYSMLVGAHRQSRIDRDDDGWTDLPGHRRVVVRPRFYWSNGIGSNAMVTAGATIENRDGGTVAGATAPSGSAYPESLRTGRWDGGAVGRLVVPAGIVSLRGSVTLQRHRHTFGPTSERDEHVTWFSEASYTATRGTQAAVIGVALQQERYSTRSLAGFDYVHTTPSLFGQVTRDLTSRFSISGSGRIDDHSEYGTFFSPRISGLIRLAHGWTMRASAGTGYYAPTPFTEETEVIGLSSLRRLSGLKAERARSGSLDLGGVAAGIELNATLFTSKIADPVALRAVQQAPTEAPFAVQLLNVSGPTRTGGAEALARWRGEPLSFTATYTFVHSTEQDVITGLRQRSPLVPRHQLGLVTMFEKEGRTRVGVEVYYTGRQSLEENPFRSESLPYTHVGVLAERRFGHARFFVNAENLLDVRQTKHDPLVRQSQGMGGRWTTDVWAPLDGRVANFGVRLNLALTASERERRNSLASRNALAREKYR